MKIWIPQQRATLLIPSGPRDSPDKCHLFIMMTDPFDNGSGVSEVLLIPICSTRPKHDPSCELSAGFSNHPFITHDSFVEYSLARTMTKESLLKGYDTSIFTPKTPVSTEVFQKVRQGLEVTRRIQPMFRDFYYSFLEKIT